MGESYPGERYAGSAAYWEDMDFSQWVSGLDPDELSVWIMVFCDVEIISDGSGLVTFRSPHLLPKPVASAIEDNAEEIMEFLGNELPEDLRHEFCD